MQIFNNEIRINRKTIIISIVAFFIIIAVFFIFSSFLAKPEEISPITDESGLLIKSSDLPQEEWERIITVEKKEGNLQLVVNEYDGYQITIPADWLVSGRATKSAGLPIYFDITSISNMLSEHSSGGSLIIKTLDNPDNLSVVQWFNAGGINNFFLEEGSKGFALTPKEDIGEGVYFISESFPKSAENIPGATPTKGGEMVSYLFPSEKNIYKVSCFALGENFEKLLDLCEPYTPTFELK